MLFDGSIRDNIAMNAPDASDEDVIHAARVACAHAFIMDLPQGYGSSVEDVEQLLVVVSVSALR